jgi:glycosyltransferase involved in cell wall biosynthesis
VPSAIPYPSEFRAPSATTTKPATNRVSDSFIAAYPRTATPPPISAVILTKNSQQHLADVLAALAWCDEVVILDTGSTDSTAAIACYFPNVHFHRLSGPFPGFGLARQQLVALARNDWILSIDSDEVLSDELAREIQNLSFSSHAVYSLPFHNYYNGRLITTCGWYPDRHERLFNRRTTNFCQSHVHERVQTETLAVHVMKNPVRHYSYNGADDFIRKMHSYSQLFARQNAGKKSSSLTKAVGRSTWAFVKSFLLERGCTQGREGFVISAYKAQTVFWKYLLLAEANRRPAA